MGSFTAMSSPCEILTETESHSEASTLLRIASKEAWRIEHKFSRYLSGNIIHQINNAGGAPVNLDEESARLFVYADECYRLSNGLFDITSGVLRRVWKFDGSDRLPDAAQVEAVLPLVGWSKAEFTTTSLRLLPGMEVDLGGLGKEYAVDRAAGLLAEVSTGSYVVNFGGDLFVSGLRAHGEPWSIGLDDPEMTGESSIGTLKIECGGVATSGDARRYLLKDGIRYGHILNPMSGWPEQGAPRSVMVVAESCMEAGVLATLAMLQGPNAESFLSGEEVVHWVVR